LKKLENSCCSGLHMIAAVAALGDHQELAYSAISMFFA
jgi:hypothetical protein